MSCYHRTEFRGSNNASSMLVGEQQTCSLETQLPDEPTSFGEQQTCSQLPGPTSFEQPTECSLETQLPPSSKMKLCPLPGCGKRVKRLWNHVFQVHKKEGRYTGILLYIVALYILILVICCLFFRCPSYQQ